VGFDVFCLLRTHSSAYTLRALTEAAVSHLRSVVPKGL
jgi:hypothetical protein